MTTSATFNPITTVRGMPRRQLFNEYWKFIYGDLSNAHLHTYDDSAWEYLQLPHDYSLSLPYTQAGEAESGYKLGDVGWYRKAFTLNESAKGKRVIVEFDAVYMNATIYINGHRLGLHPYGYTPFAYDLTEYIREDEENVLAVRVDHEFPSSRWYSGSGIYRDVHLTVTEMVHVEHNGIQVQAPGLDPQDTQTVAVDVRAHIRNEAADAVETVITQTLREKASGETVTVSTGEPITIPANSSETCQATLQAQDITLWSINNPFLYEVVTEVAVAGRVVDTVVTDYGFRTIMFHAESGFHLNGEPVKLKGVSMHSDQGALGAAAHERAMERQVEILQDMGANAIRVTHNPAASKLIEIANRRGMLIIDEAFDTWVGSKNGNIHDYARWFRKTVGDNPLLGAGPEMTWAEFDLKTMVRRGLNAPSIISWSVGNEVMEGNSGPYTEYPAILDQLMAWAAEIDSTRPATIGDNKLKANWEEAIRFGETVAAHNGLLGFNYAEAQNFDSYHEEYPEWLLYAAETASAINSRGVYKPSNYDMHLTAYDESTVLWGKLAADSWHTVITRDFVAGEFVWTGFDYLGEPTPWNNVGPGATGGWPSPKSSYFGIIDTAGLPKDRFYFYRSQWNERSTTLHLLPAWKESMLEIEAEGRVRVDVYSNASSVELIFRNAKGEETSLGAKAFTQYTTAAGHSYRIYEGNDKSEEAFRNLYLTWQVPYEAGTLYAKAYDAEGRLITGTEGRDRVTTFGEPHAVKLAADRETLVANGRDLAYLTLDIVDESGHPAADASNLVHVRVSGEGLLLALDNGDQVDHEPYASGRRKAFNGKLVAIVQATKRPGTLTVHVESEGLETQTLTLTTAADPEAPAAPYVIGYTAPKHYYVQLGQVPALAEEVTIHFSDGRDEIHPVSWNSEDCRFDDVQTVSVAGQVTAPDLTVFANVTVLEPIAALLNYALVTPVGVDRVDLPASRPLVTEAGEVLETEFPVSWDQQRAADYETAGQIIIDGQADVLGRILPVTASVRVAEPEQTLGANVAGNHLTLTREIPENPDADYLAKLTYTYATAQFLGACDLLFEQDPAVQGLAPSIELYWSNRGTEDADWIRIRNVRIADEDASNQDAELTKVALRFSGVSAVGFRIVIPRHSDTGGAGENPATGLKQVALHVVRSSLSVHESAELDQLLVNGTPVSKEALKQRTVQDVEPGAALEPVSERNLAVTVLEAHANKIHVLTESEDHTARETYTVQLNLSSD